MWTFRATPSIPIVIERTHMFALIGGAGLGAYYLMKEVPASCAPWSLANLILFTSGPFQTSKLPGSAKLLDRHRSPLTNGFMDTAAGATFGHNLKKSGYDLIIVIRPQLQRCTSM